MDMLHTTAAVPSDQPVDVVAMPPSVNRDWLQAQPALVRRKPDASLALDFSNTTQIDSAGLALVWFLADSWERAGRRVVVRNAPEHILGMLRTWKSAAPTTVPAAAVEPNVFVRLGDAGAAFWEQCTLALSMLVEMLYWGSFGLRKRRDLRKGALGDQMYQLGFKALGIVVLLSFLIGIVLALQSALFLKAYGAGIFLAQMIGWAMIREFGPLMTAVILAGRTGSATTAEIATMSVNEEIDALRTMGINPIQFVVVPKLWAITLTMPLLSIIASAAGILGGYFVSVFYLDISSSLFWGELVKYIPFGDVSAGFIKSVAFSWLIIWIGTFYGFKVRGGAEEVGKETTASVVTAIFVIIVADAVFSFVL
jgi:phospholipid/cholesterol/gamma-HCH transport system permease protein